MKWKCQNLNTKFPDLLGLCPSSVECSLWVAPQLGNEFEFESCVAQLITNIPLMNSPVPELSFLPASYRGWTRAGKRRVQDNLHAHAQNAAIFPPKSGEKPYLEVLSRFGLWRDFLGDNIQAIISAFRLIKNMSINPRSVEFHQCHAKPHSICFLSHYQR